MRCLFRDAQAVSGKHGANERDEQGQVRRACRGAQTQSEAATAVSGGHARWAPEAQSHARVRAGTSPHSAARRGCGRTGGTCERRCRGSGTRWRVCRSSRARQRALEVRYGLQTRQRVEWQRAGTRHPHEDLRGLSRRVRPLAHPTRAPAQKQISSAQAKQRG